MTAVWWIEIPVSLFAAIFGGGWLGLWLAGQPYLGAAFGLCNLLAAVVMVAKEKPSLKERVKAASAMRTPYSSVLGLVAVLLLLEALAFLAAAGAWRGLH